MSPRGSTTKKRVKNTEGIRFSVMGDMEKPTGAGKELSQEKKGNRRCTPMNADGFRFKHEQ